MNYEPIKELCKKYNADFLENELMSKHTSFRIGGACDIMVSVNCVEFLQELLMLCKNSEIPYYIVGKGSNILVSDKGLNGVVILLSNDFSQVNVNGEEIECMAGAKLGHVCQVALENELTGLEFAYGIPGTVGGAVFMNAGAYGGEMQDVVVSCKYIDNCGQIKEIPLSQMDLSYRHSVFSENGYCVISVLFKLAKGDKEKIADRMNTLMERRKDKQPLEFPSAGSTFKRPEGDFAARLIEVCGLKGAACGGAEVSTKHSGFVINKKDATFDDVMGVVDIVKEKVFEQTGIKLECEMLIME